jgi:hypothetical protein
MPVWSVFFLAWLVHPMYSFAQFIGQVSMSHVSGRRSANKTHAAGWNHINCCDPLSIRCLKLPIICLGMNLSYVMYNPNPCIAVRVVGVAGG